MVKVSSLISHYDEVNVILRLVTRHNVVNNDLMYGFHPFFLQNYWSHLNAMPGCFFLGQLHAQIWVSSTSVHCEHNQLVIFLHELGDLGKGLEGFWRPINTESPPVGTSRLVTSQLLVFDDQHRSHWIHRKELHC